MLAGPYRLVISANPVTARHGFALALRGTITARRSGAPIASAALRLTVRGADGDLQGVYRSLVIDGAYGTYVPIPNPDTWRSLHYGLEITGPLGAASARYLPPDLFDEWLVEPLVLAAAALAVAFFVPGIHPTAPSRPERSRLDR